MPRASLVRTTWETANEFLPTEHGFDEFFGNLYHLNAEEEPEDPDYPRTRRFESCLVREASCIALQMGV